MPSHRVNDTVIVVARFDVVGLADLDNVITHVGLAEPAGEHLRAKVPVIEMSPPLNGPSRLGRLDTKVLGNAGLSDDEAKMIIEFSTRHEGEHAAVKLASRADFAAIGAVYSAHPHAREHYENDRWVRTVFSCAGFVFEAYRFAQIELFDPDNLPQVDLVTVLRLYGQQLGTLARMGISRDVIGLSGDGPWPMMLCGYLFHALNRSVEDIRAVPYQPQPEHLRFA